MSEDQKYCYGCFSPKKNDFQCEICGYVHKPQNEQEHSHLPAGTELNGRYIVGKVIGAGGFGITYIAFDPKLRVRLAIKEFFPRSIASRNETTYEIRPYGEEEEKEFRNGLKYFLNEARSAAMFETNQNVVGVKDMFEEYNTAYMVMPYISGIPFDAYLLQNGETVNFKTALSILAPVMEALSAVHDANLLHRDISPENIFITDEGIPKLIDFGSARPTVASDTLSMTPVIKEGYAPLEQYSRQGEQGPWTDIYSMAATLYRAVSGKIVPPAMERFTDDKLLDLSTVCDDIPGYAVKAVEKALSLRSGDRFQSMTEFLNALTKGKEVAPLKFDEDAAISSNHKKWLIPSLVTAGIVLISVAVTLIFSSPSKEIIKERVVEKKEEVPDGTAKIELAKKDVKTEDKKEAPEKEKKTLAKKKRTPSKKKKTAKKKDRTETARKEEPKKEEQPERKETSGVSMGGKNYIYAEQAEKGLSADEYFKKGYKYELARNMPQARTYYDSACKKSHAMGCYRLGNLNKDEKTLTKARKLFSKECSRGKSCTNYANMLLKGEGGPKSPFEATTTLAKQCSSGSVSGCYLLAEIWEKGENIKKDLKKARKYFGFSCEKGSKVGCFKYGEMLENGRGGPADKAEAKKFYKKACLKGYVKACMRSK